jgi:hypothetical protein
MTPWSEDESLVPRIHLGRLLIVTAVCFAGELTAVCLLAHWGRELGWW